jgi:hypothetical protein
MLSERIVRELVLLEDGGQSASLITDGSRPIVLYRDVPTGGGRIGLPATTDVIVPVPNGHPASVIDLAGLPMGSPLLAKVRGGKNIQGRVIAAGCDWQLASYHPHQNGGGPPYDPTMHGFHTYVDHLIAWLHRLD